MKSGNSRDIENLARYLSQPFAEHFLDEKHKEHAALALQRWPLLAKIAETLGSSNTST